MNPLHGVERTTHEPPPIHVLLNPLHGVESTYTLAVGGWVSLRANPLHGVESYDVSRYPLEPRV